MRKSREENGDGKHRWLVTISEYARIDVPDFWEHERNPVRYLSRAELETKGIKLNALDFQPMPQSTAAAVPAQGAQAALHDAVAPMTIAEARKGLAATFGVKPEAVEITIRG